MSNHINRRNFFKNTALSAAGILVSKNLSATGTPIEEPPSFNLMREVMKYRKIDAHEHVGLNSSIETQLDVADRLGIEKLVVSRPVSADSKTPATPEEFRKCNDMVLNAMKMHPDRYMGLVYINPLYPRESLEEIKRCIDQGMVGLKLFNQVKISDPLFYPIIEKFIDLKMMILMHAGSAIGFGGYKTKYGNVQPNASIPEDFVVAAKRYPGAMFQYAHTAGGGDWEYACKTIKDYPNIYADISGSNNEGNMIDFALEYLGEDRLFFGTDDSYYQGVGTILSSKMNEVQRKKIFFENYNNILRKIGRNVN